MSPNRSKPGVDPDLADPEIRITEARDESYPVDITLNGEQHFQGLLAAGALPRVPSGDLAADGQRLFDTLLANGRLRSGWAEARGQAPQHPIRLRADPAAAEVHALPWELCQEDGAMLSAQVDTPFSRYLPSALPWSGLTDERPIRVLIAISNLGDLAKYNRASVDAELERDTLTATLAVLDPGELEIHFLDPPMTLERLEQALHESARGAGGRIAICQEEVESLTDLLGLVLEDIPPHLLDLLAVVKTGGYKGSHIVGRGRYDTDVPESAHPLAKVQFGQPSPTPPDDL
jgi:hypothetical protein